MILEYLGAFGAQYHFRCKNTHLTYTFSAWELDEFLGEEIELMEGETYAF